jgi:hypothetical protein
MLIFILVAFRDPLVKPCPVHGISASQRSLLNNRRPWGAQSSLTFRSFFSASLFVILGYLLLNFKKLFLQRAALSKFYILRSFAISNLFHLHKFLLKQLAKYLPLGIVFYSASVMVECGPQHIPSVQVSSHVFTPLVCATDTRVSNSL